MSQQYWPDRQQSQPQWRSNQQSAVPDRAPSSRQWGVPDRAPSSRQPQHGVMGRDNNAMGSYPHYEMPIPQVSNPRATAVTSVSNPMDKAMMKRLLELQALQEQLMHMVWDMKQGEMYQTKCIEAMQSTMDRMQSQLENMAERMTLQDRKLEGITNALVAIVAAYESSCKAVQYLSQHMQSMEKLLQHVFNNTQMDVQQQEPSHWSSTGRELLREFVALQGSNVAANIGNGNTVSQVIGEIDVDGNLHQRNDDSNQVIEPMDLSHPPTHPGVYQDSCGCQAGHQWGGGLQCQHQCYHHSNCCTYTCTKHSTCSCYRDTS